jgi:hypothetical protein
MLHMNSSRLGALLILSLSIGLARANENVSEKSLQFRTEYEDGRVERMTLRYVAHVSNEYHNTGSASKGLGHLQDTRHCEWTAYSFIQRDVCVVTRTAGLICDGKFTRIFNDSRSGESRRQDIFSGRLDAQTCADIKGQIDRTYASIKANVIAQLNPVMEKDVGNFFYDLQKSNGVRRAVRE